MISFEAMANEYKLTKFCLECEIRIVFAIYGNDIDDSFVTWLISIMVRGHLLNSSTSAGILV